MRSAARYSKVTAPGLPSSPVLYFDVKSNRAEVTVSLPTWRSWGYAHAVSGWLILAGCGLLGAGIWNWLAFIENPIGRGLGALFGFALSYGVTKPLFHAVFDGFLARQVFACRTKLWFTPERIAFRSRLYENGVVLWRSWKGHPVSARFDVSADHEAQEGANSPYQPQSLAQRRRHTACILRLIVAVSSSHRPMTSTASPLMRAIPLLEVDQRDAPRIATVLMAAATLTAKRQVRTAKRAVGVDVDATHG